MGELARDRRRYAPPGACTLVLVITLWTPLPATAQLGAIEAFARRVTDLSFNAHIGGLAPSSDEVRTDGAALRSYGLELLFEIGSVDEVVGSAPEVQDSVTLNWTEMTVVVGEDGSVDTTYVYEVGPPRRPPARTRTIWTFEMGLGYGQTVGFESGDPTLDLRGQIRDLPAASIYASYEPIGAYFGLRSGFMRLRGLQVYDESDAVFAGDADSFLLAALVGDAVEVVGINIFIEAAYSVRSFPSVEWRSVDRSSPLNPALPRKLSLSAWTLGTGVQFGIGGG
jgi:hypothetical protein